MPWNDDGNNQGKLNRDEAEKWIKAHLEHMQQHLEASRVEAAEQDTLDAVRRQSTEECELPESELVDF